MGCCREMGMGGVEGEEPSANESSSKFYEKDD